MTASQRSEITGVLTAIGVTLSTLAALPQTLGPFADILPEKYKVTIITISLGAILAARIINALWSIFFPSEPVPVDISGTAGKPLPQEPNLSGATLTYSTGSQPPTTVSVTPKPPTPGGQAGKI